MASATFQPPLALAIDVGTSSCRAGLYDVRGQRVSGVGSRIAYTPTLTDDGGAELDADALIDRVVAAIDAVMQQADGLPPIAAVGVSTFWHSLLGVDERGRAVTPIYPWMDARSREAAAQLRRRLDAQALHGRTGCPLHWCYWPAKLTWLAQTQPRLFGRVRRWVSFGEYLALRLFGSTTVSVSMASGTGLFDQHRQAWDDLMLEVVGLTPDHLSAIERVNDHPAELQPEWAARWPLLRGVPWLPAIGDGACSNVGAGSTTRERAALMIGTSGAMRVLWRGDTTVIPPGVWCYRLDHEHFVLGGAINDGGSLFAWMRATLRLPGLDAEEQAVAALEPDAHGLTLFPAWAGERSPGWADDARGAIVGMRLDTTPTEILRAAMEAVGLRFAAIDALLHRAVPEANQVVATGGALLRSPTWLQIMADVLGRPVHASAELEASSRGAALVALNAVVGLGGGIESLTPEILRVYEPVPAHVERYRAAADRQEQLYRALVDEPLVGLVPEAAPPAAATLAVLPELPD